MIPVSLSGTATVSSSSFECCLRLLTSDTEYLRGTAQGDECEPLFQQYKACLSVSALLPYRLFEYLLTGSQKALKERGIDRMLEEARVDNKDNDSEYLKPSIRPSCTLLLKLISRSSLML